jgi:hypothetical protein
MAAPARGRLLHLSQALHGHRGAAPRASGAGAAVAARKILVIADVHGNAAALAVRQRKLYRVGPNCETWPNILTGNPY